MALSWLYIDKQTLSGDGECHFFRLPNGEFIYTIDEKIYHCTYNMDGTFTRTEIDDITTLDANAEYVSRIFLAPKPTEDWDDIDRYIYLICCKEITVTTNADSYNINVLSSIQYIDLADIASGIIAKIDPPVKEADEDECWVNARSIQPANYMNGAVDEAHIICAGGQRKDRGGPTTPNTAEISAYRYDLTNSGWTQIWRYDPVIGRADTFFSESILLLYGEGSTDIDAFYYGLSINSPPSHYVLRHNSSGEIPILTGSYITGIENPTTGILHDDGMQSSSDAKGTYGILVSKAGSTQYVISLRNDDWSTRLKYTSDTLKLREIAWKGGCLRNDTTGKKSRGTTLEMSLDPTGQVDISINELCDGFDANTLTKKSNLEWWNDTINYGIMRVKEGTNVYVTALTTDEIPSALRRYNFKGLNVRQAIEMLAEASLCNFKRPFLDTAIFVKKNLKADASQAEVILTNQSYTKNFRRKRNPLYTAVRITNDYDEYDYTALFGDTSSRLVLEINNRFIHPAGADEIGQLYLDYFATVREYFKIPVFFMIEMGIQDGITLKLYDKDNSLIDTIYTIIGEVSYSDSDKITRMKLIDIDPEDFRKKIGYPIGIGGSRGIK